MLETNNPTKWPEVEWGNMYNFLKETRFFVYISRDISFGTSCKDFPVYSECIFSNLGKIVSRRHTEIFFSYFSQKTEFDISPLETIYIKCQILFSGKNIKTIKFSSAELPKKTLKVKNIRSEFEVSHNIYLFIYLFQNCLQRFSNLLRVYTNIRESELNHWFS